MHSYLLSFANHIADFHATAAAYVPNPGQGKRPPGAAKLELMLSWVAWVVFALCVTGVLIVAGRMAISHRRGEGGEHATGLAWVGAACILAGSCSAVVAALVG